jgi:hypothetical protein
MQYRDPQAAPLRIHELPAAAQSYSRTSAAGWGC